ncbi:MAG TPA: hypothetical protein PL187_00190 [Caldilinea sp.]|nr:hypothetical protein [Caldilinea sp.]
MYALIWLSRYAKNDYQLEVCETVEDALDAAESNRLERRNYGKTWWITAPMARRETFVGAQETILAVSFAKSNEDED